MVTLEEITEREEDGKIFTRLPDDLDSSTLDELINLELPEGIVVNNIEYDPKNARMFKDTFEPRLLKILYYMSLGYNNGGIAKNMDIKEKTVENYLNHIYQWDEFPKNMIRRVLMTADFRKTFPHLFPIQQYKPTKLSDAQYEVARMVAQGHYNLSIAGKPENIFAVQYKITRISEKIIDQLPSDYNLRVCITNIFNSGDFYSKSNNPRGIGLPIKPYS